MALQPHTPNFLTVLNSSLPPHQLSRNRCSPTVEFARGVGEATIQAQGRPSSRRTIGWPPTTQRVQMRGHAGLRPARMALRVTRYRSSAGPLVCTGSSSPPASARRTGAHQQRRVSHQAPRWQNECLFAPQPQQAFLAHGAAPDNLIVSILQASVSAMHTLLLPGHRSPTPSSTAASTAIRQPSQPRQECSWKRHRGAFQ